MDDLLTIGVVAKLLGISTKTIRHYHKLGLLGEADRAANGYRHYRAADLLRLQRIRRLQALGLSLGQVKAILGSPSNDHSLRHVLAALHGELSRQIAELEARRERVARLLAANPRDALDQPEEPSPTVRLFEEHLGEQVSLAPDEARKLDNAMLSQLDMVLGEEPAYQQQMRELAEFIADRPEDYRELMAWGEAFMALAEASTDSPAVAQLAARMQQLRETNAIVNHMATLNFPSSAASTLAGELMGELVADTLSPAQRRVFEVINDNFTAEDAEDAEGTEN
ncbi:MAG: MerR family transcriptional regulator [Chloroflexaceae bacterium]|jgi:DNA-binding transcriptional MerR regulator|nr:MerR family transcriptional regulator [Chloroflexaceae bacterium]